MARLIIFLCVLFISNIIYSDSFTERYCDESAGHSVLKDGDYSQKYCSGNAVMSLDGVSGCCTWSGGILLIKAGKVICSDGTPSRVCSDIEAYKKPQKVKSDQSITIYDTHNEVSR